MDSCEKKSRKEGLHLEDWVNYCPETGAITWKVGGRRRKIGSRVGSIDKRDYMATRINGVFIYGHQIAWYFISGGFSKNIIDHINGKRWDNRASNLREVTYSQNVANARLSSRNTSGFKGVVWNKANRKWQSIIGFNGKKIYLGLYKDKLDAARAYKEASERLFGEYANPTPIDPDRNQAIPV